MNETIAGASPVDQSVGRHVPGLIAAEMAEYSDGAYADHGCARDQLERFAAEVQAPLLARIRELTLYAASVEAERDEALEDAVRYRWLRNAENGGEFSVGQQCSVCDEYPKYEEVAWYYDIELDGLIDAAMQRRVGQR